MFLCFLLDYYNWEWQDEKGGWNPYGIKASLDLENGYHGDDKTVDVEACSRSYTIDIGKMEQTNTVTNVIRKVARNVASESRVL